MQAPARNALITGSTRGIGRAVAWQLAAAGYQVFVTGRNEDELRTVMQGLDCPGLAVDLAQADAAPKLFSAAVRALGSIDVLVNNAGFNRAKEPISQVSVEDLDTSYAVNVRAPILLAREALRLMAPRKAGHIVNVLSSVVHARMENYAVYSTMKSALHAFTGCLIKEARQAGVKVTGIYPGGVNTRFRAQERPDYMQAESVARLIVQCLTAPDDVVVHELTFRPMVETNF